jgi:hypothetical protein
VSLKSPATFLLAWLVVPLLVAVASAGLGAAIASLSGMKLGVLTLPAGFLGGIALMTAALEIGVSGITTVIVTAVCALAGLIVFALTRPKPLLIVRPRAELLWAAACGFAAFAIGMAPLAGSGRSGIVGYVLNNDPSVHVSAVELLKDNGAHTGDSGLSSYHSVGTLFEGEYPLGSYPWVLLGRVLGGIDAFHIWTPLIAVTSAMTALVCYWILRQIGAGPPFAGGAAALIASGYLPYSYLAQGGAKEVITALSIYGTVALFVLAATQRFDWRGLLASAIAAAAAIDNLGLGALAWLGPAAVLVTGVLIWHPPKGRSRQEAARTLGLVGLVPLVAALPAILSSINYLKSYEEDLVNPAQVGNLLGAVPWSEAFNVWFAYDYRISPPDLETLTAIGVLLAAGLAAAGIIEAVHRRHYALALAVVTGATGTILISSRYAVYFDAKAYMTLAPALGLATAMGVLWLCRRSYRRERLGGIVVGLLLAAGVLLSDGYVYAGSWMTPKDRFQELTDIGKKFRGQGPILVNEREEYAKYFLRDSRPWESWGSWQPERGLRLRGVPPVPTTPDFDYYTTGHMKRFELLLDRKRPGGSAPPGNFRVIHETAHYRVWKRVSQPAAAHLALGLGGLSGTGRLDCGDDKAKTVFMRAARGGRIRIAYGRAHPILSRPRDWDSYGTSGAVLTKGFVTWRSGFAVAQPDLRRGRYLLYAQGSFGPGLRVYVDGRPAAETFGDLGLQDGWQPLGRVSVMRARPSIVLIGLAKPRWQAGSRRFDIIGPLAFVPEKAPRGIEEMDVRQARRLCGEHLDWVELVPRKRGR